MASTNEKQVEAFAESLRAEGRAERTVAIYCQLVRDFLKLLGRHIPRRLSVERFIADPLKHHGRPSASTRNQALSALRAFSRWAVRMRLWREDPTRELRFLREPSRQISVLYAPEVQRLLTLARSASRPGEETRDLAILTLEYCLGLRVSEIHGLNVAQLDLFSRQIVGLRRKNGKTQDLHVGEHTLRLLTAYLKERANVASPSEEALFVSYLGTRLSVRSIQRITERLRGSVASSKRITSHSGRHSFITNSLIAGAELVAVSQVAGHADVRTTQKYVHLADPHVRRVSQFAEDAMIPPDLVAPPPNPADERCRSPENSASESLDVHAVVDDAA